MKKAPKKIIQNQKVKDIQDNWKSVSARRKGDIIVFKNLNMTKHVQFFFMLSFSVNLIQSVSKNPSEPSPSQLDYAQGQYRFLNQKYNSSERISPTWVLSVPGCLKLEDSWEKVCVFNDDSSW